MYGNCLGSHGLVQSAATACITASTARAEGICMMDDWVIFFGCPGSGDGSGDGSGVRK